MIWHRMNTTIKHMQEPDPYLRCSLVNWGGASKLLMNEWVTADGLDLLRVTQLL